MQVIEEWTKDGVLHREDGPALIDSDGEQWWYYEGLVHREDGPALICANGEKCWYIRNSIHREDGPAVEYPDGQVEWWWKDRLVTLEKYCHILKVEGALSDEDIFLLKLQYGGKENR